MIALLVSVFLGRPLAALFLEASEGEIIGNARMLLYHLSLDSIRKILR